MVDVGVTTTPNAAGYGPNLTLINEENPASEAFTCSKIKIHMTGSAPINVKVGSFFGGSGTWENRDSAALGAIATGEEVVVTGLSIEFQNGDVIGMFDSSGGGGIESNTSGGSGVQFKSGDQFGAGEQSGYTDLSDDTIYLFGDDTGAVTVGNAPAMGHNF